MTPRYTTPRWGAVAVVAVGTLVAGVVPTGDSVARLGPFGLVTLDLWLHAGAYCLLQLAVLSAVTAEADPPLPASLTPLVVVAYGSIIELIQSGLAYRSASLVDGVANAVGVLFALCLWVILVPSR